MIAYAIAHRNHEFLGRVLDAVGHVLQGPPACRISGYDAYIAVCLGYNNATALQMARKVSPGIDAKLAEGLDYEARYCLMGALDPAFFEMWVDAGGLMNFTRCNPKSVLSLVTSGRALRALAKAGVDPTMELERDTRRLGALHFWALQGGSDSDALNFRLEHGLDIDALTLLGHRPLLSYGRLRHGGLDMGRQRWCTPLDLAAQNRNCNTMEHLIALGASLGGSSDIFDRDGTTDKEAFSSTTPLHELFSELFDEVSDDVFDEVSDVVFDQPGSRVLFTVRTGDPIPEQEGPACPNREKYMFLTQCNVLQDLSTFAKLILQGARCLLTPEGSCRHINRDIPGLGTPLSRFLTLAYECRACYPIIRKTYLMPPCSGPETPCAHWWDFRNEMHALRPLAEVCDLLINAGAQIPFEDYEEGEEGVPRLLRLLEIRAKAFEGPDSADIMSEWLQGLSLAEETPF